MPKTKKESKTLKNYKHTGKRKNIPEVGLVTSSTDKVIDKKKYKFDPFLNPNLEWAGKVEKDHLEIDNVSLHVHERIDPKQLIEKLKNQDQKKDNNFKDRQFLWTLLME